MTCSFIPPYLLDRLASSGDAELATCGDRTRRIDEVHRQARAGTRAGEATRERATADTPWQVYTADNGDSLPGRLVQSAGANASGDAAVDEAATGLAATLSLLQDLGRASYDDSGATVVATVHYERGYDNAFWDGSQLVFGDGDGTVFDRFTKPIDVLGHELTHAVTQYAAGLTYQGQSGALNESVSDAFGACVKQRHLGQDAASADWLVGEGMFLPGVQGKALRSMAAPGTAYDDPRLGKDPQVATMADYVQTSDDNGGVHLNSGIPNKAFQLAATAIGGTTWEGAGRIWYAALTSGLAADTDFATFASATVAAAGEHAGAVRDAWQQVGVGEQDGTADPRSVSGAASAPGLLRVRRSGGFAGRTVEGRLDLDSQDPRVPEARRLLDRVDLRRVATGSPAADRFVYVFEVGAVSVDVHEQALTPELAELARLVLDG